MRNKFLTNKFLIFVFFLTTIFIDTTIAASTKGTANTGASVNANTGVKVNAFSFCNNSGIISRYDWGCNCYDDICTGTIRGIHCNIYFRSCWGSGCPNTYAWTSSCF